LLLISELFLAIIVGMHCTVPILLSLWLRGWLVVVANDWTTVCSITHYFAVISKLE